MEGDLSNEGSDVEDACVAISNILALCQKLKKICVCHGTFEHSLELARLLKRYQGHLTEEKIKGAKQVTLEEMSWGV